MSKLLFICQFSINSFKIEVKAPILTIITHFLFRVFCTWKINSSDKSAHERRIIRLETDRQGTINDIFLTDNYSTLKKKTHVTTA